MADVRRRLGVLRAHDGEDEHASGRLAAGLPGEPAPRSPSAQVGARVAEPARKEATAPERPRAPAQVVGIAGARRHLLRPDRLAQAPECQRREHDAVAAAAPDDVPQAAGERAELARDRRRDALARVVAPRVAPAAVGGAREAADASVLARPPVIDAGRRDVADRPAGGVQAPLPVLLVAVEVEAGVEAADALQRAATQRQVGAPHELGVTVVGAEVERGHRRRLAPAGVEVRPREVGLDRAAECLMVGVLLRRRRSARASQPGHARASSSRKQRRSAVAVAIAVLRAALRPRVSPWAT